MSPWPGKYVIGLTGNIAAGKSVVRRMLEHLGAYGIDADSLSHRAMVKGAPGYQPIVDYFGKWVLDDQEQIDRSRVGSIVFSNPAALAKLESILHPLVRQAVGVLVQRSRQPVIVIEAIKLLDGELRKVCDTIWVADATEEIRLQRLMAKRGLTESEARKRIAAQDPQEEKAAAADVIIHNGRSFEDTWKQVSTAWILQVRNNETEPSPAAAEAGELAVRRARPSQASEIADFVTRATNGRRKLTRADVMAEFGEKAFFVLVQGRKMVGLLGWQVENLVTRATDFYLDGGMPLSTAAGPLIEQMEAASGDLQSEAALLFLPDHLANQAEIWRKLGYEKQTIEALTVRAWQEAARETRPSEKSAGSELYFKRLRADRILRPI